MRIGARCLVGERYGEVYDIAGNMPGGRFFKVKFDDGEITTEQEEHIMVLPKGYKENVNSLCFCPHCGEDLRGPLLPEGPSTMMETPEGLMPVDPSPKPQPHKTVKQQEVTAKEVEAIWGLQPLPTGMRPFGVVTDGISDLPLALAASSVTGELWEIQKGEVKMLDLSAPVASVVARENHACAPDTSIRKESLGNSRYGGRLC